MGDEGRLITEQLRHMIDLIDARLDRIEQNQMHLREMLEHRMGYLEQQMEDHEGRIRAATEGVTHFNSIYLDFVRTFGLKCLRSHTKE